MSYDSFYPLDLPKGMVIDKTVGSFVIAVEDSSRHAKKPTKPSQQRVHHQSSKEHSSAQWRLDQLRKSGQGLPTAETPTQQETEEREVSAEGSSGILSRIVKKAGHR